MISIDDLALFVSIAQGNSITGAAKRLKMPKATVSRRLSELEKHLGCTLFHRSTRKMTLTDDGFTLLTRSSPVVEQAFAVLDTLALPQTQVQGKVKITATNAIGEHLLFDGIQALRQEYPAIHVELLLTEDSLNIVEYGIDIAIRLGALADSELLARRLTSVTRYIVCTPECLKNVGCSIETLGDLGRVPFIRQSARIRHLPLASGKHLITNSILHCNNLNLVRRAILSHSGAGVLPDFMCTESLASGDLVQLLPNETLAETTVSLVSPPNKYPNASAKIVKQYLLEHLGTNASAHNVN